MPDIYQEPMHGDDRFQLLKSVLHKPLSEMSREGFETLQLMVDLFTQFAGTGEPSVGDIQWLPVTVETKLLFGLQINEKRSEVRLLPEAIRMSVFEEIGRLEEIKKYNLD